MKRTTDIVTALLAVVVFIYLVYRLWFLRQPERNTPKDDSLFISPANGIIVAIRPYNVETDGPYLLETKNEDGAIRIPVNDVAATGTIITISLALDDVHWQRAPTAGAVGFTRYTAGEHKPIAVDGEPRNQNTHNQILVTGVGGNNYKVVQIAGFIARSIDCQVQAGQWVEQGQIIGCIKLGSQVTIILASEYEVTAGVGDYVTDGESVLAVIILPPVS